MLLLSDPEGILFLQYAHMLASLQQMQVAELP